MVTDKVVALVLKDKQVQIIMVLETLVLVGEDRQVVALDIVVDLVG